MSTKNATLTANNYWLPSDFQQFIYPYFEIFNIEHSKHGNNFYLPTLMEIIATENPNKNIVKIAFIGHNTATKENQIKAIYNIIAHIENEVVVFSKYLHYATQNWTEVSKGSITYKISTLKQANEKEINLQLEAVDKVCQFFNCAPIPITYYSCIDPKELFNIKGFDYNPMMYVDKTGGIAEFGNMVFSANNSELYTHEIIHVYINNLFPSIGNFLNEGIATLLAGSGNYDYAWHRNKLAKFLKEHKDYDVALHTDAFERIYFEKETSITYVTAALILERTVRLYGKEKLMALLQSNKDLWASLKAVGLTKENINKALRIEIEMPYKSIW